MDLALDIASAEISRRTRIKAPGAIGAAAVMAR
jgi:hypothetical protein